MLVLYSRCEMKYNVNDDVGNYYWQFERIYGLFELGNIIII